MYPTTIEQNRQDGNHPQTVHLHMHQLCTCVHPYYSSYRPAPIIAAPFPVHPIPRPYNLQHYQYTQFNVTPYNFPLGHGSGLSQTPPPSTLAPPTSVEYASARDRRPYEGQDSATADARGDGKTNRDFFQDFLSMESLNDGLQSVGLQDTAPTENFTKFLEQGCILAEKIATRNQHRPCFKNIQNLCNRTRGEILKPSNTVSNIHSQGIPWATKDFIYAFVRLINCWHMLKGYLDSKEGTLTNIDKELTPEFKTCYLNWEKDTKELSTHMVRIFSNLDRSVTNPSTSYVLRNKQAAPNPKPPVVPPLQDLIVEKEGSTKGVRGIIHLQQQPPEPAEPVMFSESTVTSPREDDSDTECRVYMKPGSYNVPKKPGSSDNSTPSIEFFDTAQNVSVHYKKMAKKKSEPLLTTTDKIWQDAQCAVPYLLNKINPQTLKDSIMPNCEESQDALKYFIDLNTLDQGSVIQEWLDNNNFVEDANPEIGDNSMQFSGSHDVFMSGQKPITLLQRGQGTSPRIVDIPEDLIVNSIKNYNMPAVGTMMSARSSKGPEDVPTVCIKELAPFRKNVNMYEYENGGLTSNTILMLEKLIKGLKEHLIFESLPKGDDINNPTNLDTVYKKLKARKYLYVNEIVRDIRHFLNNSNTDDIFKLSNSSKIFEEQLANCFPNVDFSHVTGERMDDMGFLIFKRPREEN